MIISHWILLEKRNASPKIFIENKKNGLITTFPTVVSFMITAWKITVEPEGHKRQ